MTWFPSYGAEMRGGTANCTVVISDEMIGSPVVLSPDILVAMNKASFDKFQPLLRRKGLLFYDSSLVLKNATRKDITPVPVPATQIASSEGNTKSANMVMLGALVARSGILDRASVLGLFADPKDTSVGANTNRRALIRGMTYIEDKKG